MRGAKCMLVAPEALVGKRPLLRERSVLAGSDRRHQETHARQWNRANKCRRHWEHLTHHAGGSSAIVNDRFVSMGWGWMTAPGHPGRCCETLWATCTHTRTRELTSVLVASTVPKKIEQPLLHHSLSPSADKPQIESSGQPRYRFARSRQPQ